MSDEKLDSFLKKHAPSPPPARLGEKERIWRAIEAESSRAPWWRGVMSFRFALPAAAICALALMLVVQQQKRDVSAERILGAALAYQMEELEPGPGFF